MMDPVNPIDWTDPRLPGWLLSVAQSYQYQRGTHLISAELVDQVRAFLGMPAIDRAPPFTPTGGE